ncbi:ankyrin repeat-containing domain protein [Aspergillus pseudoustus]|uniref:Ankyrin repeat-containing domain protein n=1 Tax=Aspergillus pseudoustus TaxID=1810923 RepID=A0ABR4ISH0_9EURO
MRVGEGRKSSRTLISHLAEFGDAILLRKLLKTGQYRQIQHDKSRVYKAQLSPLHYASTEAVVELLKEFAQEIGLFVGLAEDDAATKPSIFVSDESSKTIFSQQIIEYWPRFIGQSCLAYAAERGFEQVAKFAIQHVSHTINKADSQGRTPFCLATQGRINHPSRLVILKLLLGARASPDTPDVHGSSPLHLSVSTAFNEEIIQFLASINKVNLEYRDNQGLTTLPKTVDKNRN